MLSNKGMRQFKCNLIDCNFKDNSSNFSNYNTTEDDYM
jgi:hypothetical protein